MSDLNPQQFSGLFTNIAIKPLSEESNTVSTNEESTVPDGKKILLVEDEKPLSKVMSLKLTAEGFNIVQAFNGIEALEKIKSTKFDLILLDLVMPEMNGFEVLENLKHTGSKIPVIVTSNLSQKEDEPEFAGVVGR